MSSHGKPIDKDARNSAEVQLFSVAATDVLAELKHWLTFIATERRLSPKTCEAYARDVGFFLAFLTVAVSTVYAIRASYWTTPLIERHGLDFDVNSDGKLLVGPMARPGERGEAPSATVVAVNGRPVPPGRGQCPRGQSARRCRLR